MAVNNHPEGNDWITRVPGYRSELYVYKHTAYPACIEINWTFNMIFSLNAPFKLISKKACICLCDVIIPWRIPGIIFHPVNVDRAKKKMAHSIFWGGLCPRNSLQQEVALTNVLIWKRSPHPFLFPRSAGSSAVALVSIRDHWLSPTQFLPHSPSFLFSFLCSFHKLGGLTLMKNS